MEDLLAAVLSAAPPAADTLAAWWSATADLRATGVTTIGRALLGGAGADRLGFAFAGGYAEALRALVPSSAGALTALCATEEGGAHPRAIRTTLAADPGGGYRLRGRKKWATGAGAASELLVIASIGTEDGRNRLRAVRVSTAAPGVRLTATSAAFVPEVPHAEVALDDVAVTDADLLPGDGYDDYLKPFRTVEDLHVHAALLGYLSSVIRRHRLDAALLDRALALACSTGALAGLPRAAASTHLALAGLIELTTTLVADVEAAWAPLGGDEHARWRRDRPLLRVASAARAARRDKARASLLP